MTTVPKEHLQPWYDRWLKEHEKTDLLFARNVAENGRPRLHQVHFVRDDLSLLWWADVEYDKRAPALPRDDTKETAYVIGEHHSKSVRLPVYSLERPDLGLQFVLRENYYDWNISVVSERPIPAEILKGFDLGWRKSDQERFPKGYPLGSGYSWGYCFFQGFPYDLRFGPYEQNPRRFSICLVSDYSVYTFLWLILRELRPLAESAA